MKQVIALVLIASLAGCTTDSMSKIDAAIQKSAPVVCDAINVAHTAYVTSGHGSIKDKATVEEAFNATVAICADPTKANSTQLASLAIKLSMIVSALRNGG